MNVTDPENLAHLAASLGLDAGAFPASAVIARSHFGASAPIKDLLKHFGFTGENVHNAAKALLAGQPVHGPGKD